MKTLIFRAHKLCDLPEDLQEELLFLKDTFISNDFPPRVVDRIFSTYKPGEKQKMESFDYTLCLPFVPGFSENLKENSKNKVYKLLLEKDKL